MKSEDLQTAILNCDLNLLDDILNNGFDVNRKFNFNSFTSPLIYAIDLASDPCTDGGVCKYDEVILRLINAGADVNFRSCTEVTPLMYALQTRKVGYEVIHELIRRGAHVNAECTFHRTPLHLAIKHNRDIRIIRELLNAGAYLIHSSNDISLLENLIQQSLLCDSTELLSVVKIAGLNINSVDILGRNLLMLFNNYCQGCNVSHCSKKKFINFLLDNGIDVKHVDVAGNNIIYWTNCRYLIELAVKCGVCFDEMNIWGLTPLMSAAFHNDFSRVRNLLVIRANLNYLDFDLETVLYLIHFRNSLWRNAVTLALYFCGELYTSESNSEVLDIFGKFADYSDYYDSNYKGIIKFFLFYEKEFIEQKVVFMKFFDFENEWLQLYVNTCKKEMIKMKNIFIKDGLSFYDFCILKKFHSSKFVNISVNEYNYTYEKIEKIFPIYEDLIIMRIIDNKIQKSRWNLINNLDKVIVQPLVDYEPELSLYMSYDCLHYMCKYLSIKEIFNLFLASVGL